MTAMTLVSRGHFTLNGDSQNNPSFQKWIRRQLAGVWNMGSCSIQVSSKNDESSVVLHLQHTTQTTSHKEDAHPWLNDDHISSGSKGAISLRPSLMSLFYHWGTSRRQFLDVTWSMKVSKRSSDCSTQIPGGILPNFTCKDIQSLTLQHPRSNILDSICASESCSWS